MLERPALDKPCEAVVQALAVEDAGRSAGIGRALMREAERWAADRVLSSVAAVARTPKTFALSGAVAAGDSVIAEDPRYPIHVGARDGVTRRSMDGPAARFVPGRVALQPTLTLDVVPVGGDKFRVYFKGQGRTHGGRLLPRFPTDLAVAPLHLGRRGGGARHLSLQRGRVRYDGCGDAG